MTSVLHHGSPGSYKTYSIVQNILIPALQAGRLVITNIRGFNDIEKIKSVSSVPIPDTAAIWYLEPDDDGFKMMATFFHWAPAGALIAMDEGQRIYPTRNRRFDDLDLKADEFICDQLNNPLVNPKTNVNILRPKTVEIAFDQHRHFNWDIYISTPNISKIHKEIRHVVEWAYRHRNNTGLLPWLKNTWTEFRHDAENNGKSISHYSGSPKRYKADPKIFACYQSTATGTAQGSNENISIFRDSRLRFLLVVIVVCVSYFIYAINAAYNRVKASPPAVVQAPIVSNPEPVKTPVSLPAPVPVAVSNGQSSAQNVNNDLMQGAQFFWVGDVNGQPIFEVKIPSLSAVFPMSYDDLRRLGVTLNFRGSSFLSLTYKDKIIYAFTKPRAAEVVNREVVQQAVNVQPFQALQNSLLQQ